MKQGTKISFDVNFMMPTHNIQGVPDFGIHFAVYLDKIECRGKKL